MGIDMSQLAFPKGRVRLKGLALTNLRRQCWLRDRGICQKCGVATLAGPNVHEANPLRFDMSHIISRGAGGADVLANVETLCHRCHMTYHGCHN